MAILLQKYALFVSINTQYKYFFINDNYDNLDNFFLAALLPMATSLSPINVVLVVQVVVNKKIFVLCIYGNE